MKKTYLTPITKQYSLRPRRMIAGSPTNMGFGEGNATGTQDESGDYNYSDSQEGKGDEWDIDW